MQRFGERDQIDGLLGFAESDHLIENAAMLFEEEIFGLKILDGGVESVIVEQNGAEDGAFGVEILRERAFDGSRGSHVQGLGDTSLFIRSSYNTQCHSAQAGLGPENFPGNCNRKDWVHCERVRAWRQSECCANFCAAVQNGEKNILRLRVWHDKARGEKRKRIPRRARHGKQARNDKSREQLRRNHEYK
jgi:hypothetical protein